MTNGERSDLPAEERDERDEADLDDGADDRDDVDDVEDGGDDGGEPPRAAGPDRLHGLIGYILGQIVSKPEDVKIELAESDRRRVYEVRVAADDVGVVIGRSGRTINAIRTLLRGVPDAPERVWVELIEEDEGRGRRSRRDNADAGPDRFEGEEAEGEPRSDEPSHADDAPEHGDDRDGGHGEDRGHGDDRDGGHDRGHAGERDERGND